jgi:glutaredoxin-like YruB-family protein
MKTVLAILLLMISCTATAQIYKWTDKHGVVHYEDQPPEKSDKVPAAKIEKVELTPIQILDDGQVKNPGKQNESLWAQWMGKAKELKTDLLKQFDQLTNKTPVVTNDTVVNSNTTISNRANNVEIYTTAWCPSCKKAKRWLAERGIAYKEYDVEKDHSAALRMNKLGGGGGVPFAVINGKTVLGFDADGYQAALH